MAGTAKVGTATTVVFATSAFAANIMSVDGSGIEERPSIKTSHMGTTDADTFIPGDLVDGGEYTLEIQWTGEDDPPTGGVAELITINWAGTLTSSSFSGFMTSCSESIPLEEMMTATCVLKVAGAITRDVNPA